MRQWNTSVTVLTYHSRHRRRKFYITPIIKVQLEVFSVEAELLDRLTAVIRQASGTRRFGPTVGAAAVFKEEAAVVGED